MRNERLLQAKCIRHLERYFRENYIDPTIKDDLRCNTFEYALEAYEELNESITNREQERDFVYLSGLNYEEFVKFYEGESWIDINVDSFEKR